MLERHWAIGWNVIARSATSATLQQYMVRFMQWTTHYCTATLLTVGITGGRLWCHDFTDKVCALLCGTSLFFRIEGYVGKLPVPLCVLGSSQHAWSTTGGELTAWFDSVQYLCVGILPFDFGLILQCMICMWWEMIAEFSLILQCIIFMCTMYEHAVRMIEW